MTTLSPNFKKMLKGAGEGEVILPIIRTALWNPSFESFTVKVEGFNQRKPDGWFHPSTHPLWPERMLQYYVTHPHSVIVEPFDPTSTMAVTQGQFWHTFIEKVLVDAGVWKDCEVYVEDRETGSHGHMDGVGDDEVGEFKTMIRAKSMKIVKGPPDDPAVVDSFRKLCPEYYAQGQEYMRLSGFRKWRGVILSLEYPFEMREVAMDYDYEHNYAVREKYLRVRQAAADQQLLGPCCAPKSALSRSCPFRAACPMGSA